MLSPRSRPRRDDRRRLPLALAALSLLAAATPASATEPARLALFHGPDDTGGMTLEKLRVALDGKDLGVPLPASGAGPEEALFSGTVEPGVHALEVEASLAGAGSVFSYVDGYRVKLRSVLDVEVVAERGIAIRSRILPKGGITTPWEEQNKLVLTLSATEGAAAESAAVAAGASTAPTAPAAPAAPAAPSLAPEPPPAVASAPEPAPEPPPKLAAAREPAAAPGTGEGALAARADPERAARVAAAPSPAVASAPPAPAAAPARWTAVDECEGVVLRFDFDRAALPDDARRVLDRFASCAAAAGLQVQVDGHGDARGGEEYNRWLAWDRAASVTAYLREHGVADRRIVTRSHGAARPLCAEASEDCHARNRRVELIPAR